MCQYSTYAVLANAMRTQQRLQQQGGALPHPNNGQSYQALQQNKITTHSVLQANNGENVPRRNSPHGHKMTKGRRSSMQNITKMSRCESSNKASSRCRSGNKSAGSSPTKQYYYGLTERTNVATWNSFETRSRSYTPPSREQTAGARRSPSNSPVPNLTYAGARFSEPPSPKVLPKPPTHWFAAGEQPGQTKSSCVEMTNALKGMLKVQC